MPARPVPPPGPDTARGPADAPDPGSRPETAATAPATTVAMGRVVAVFGVRGWVKVESYTRPANGLTAYRRWFLDGPERPPHRVRALRPQGSIFVAHLAAPGEDEPMADRDAATALVGREIFVPRAELPPAPAGQTYWFDLLGMTVVNPAGDHLGRVARLVENGAQDVLVLDAGADAPPRLIPFVRGPVIERVDEARRLIVALWDADW